VLRTDVYKRMLNFDTQFFGAACL